MTWLYQIPILLFSVILHEYAHGWMAERKGDDTARVMGRLTFNPLAHIDPVGSVLLPLIAALTGGPLIGWAKPVPVNPYRLNDPTRDMMWVGAAGPVSNLLLAVVCSFALFFLKFAGIEDKLIYSFLGYAVVINVLLPVFNMVPVPPLDGSRVLSGLLPSRIAYEYMKIEPYGIFIIFILISSGFFWRLIMPAVYAIVGLLVGWHTMII
ncbi:MAG: site-2 protease family protein [Elusimicrobia bacterium HGW-Elusimicrobia-1]|jgi:Zn-dependent protease|nr:MAG: site-2 protease family protein [Elusimicrobia bacterium HGW-Elusimicrobia-1]